MAKVVKAKIIVHSTMNTLASNFIGRIQMIRWTFAVGAALILSGCELRDIPSYSITRFYEPNFTHIGKTFVVQTQKNQVDDLRWQHYATIIKKYLVSHGMREGSTGKADYSVSFQYGVGDKEQNIGSSPVIGQTGTISSSTSTSCYGGYGGYGRYGGRGYGRHCDYETYNTPIYGIVGSKSYSYDTYARWLQVEVSNLKSKKVVYETKVTNTGSTNEFNSVAGCMIYAGLKDFPGGNAKTEIIYIDTTRQSCDN